MTDWILSLAGAAVAFWVALLMFVIGVLAERRRACLVATRKRRERLGLAPEEEGR